MNKSQLEIEILEALKEDDDNDTYNFRENIDGKASDLKIAQTINELINEGYITGPQQSFGAKGDYVCWVDKLYITKQGRMHLKNIQ